MHHEEPDGSACYGAWVCSDTAPKWVHQASYRVAKGKPFGGFYSFVEDFRRDGQSTQQLRRAQFGPAWTWSESEGWLPATSATFTASEGNSPFQTWSEKPDTIDTEPGSKPGTQILANGGDLHGESKLHKSFALDPGSRGPPELPAGLRPATVFSSAAPTSPPKDAPPLQKPTPITAKCPLCHVKGNCAPFCCGEVCRPAQCQGSDAPFSGKRCIWKCANGSLCHFHASGGKKCPLCGRGIGGAGPFCQGACCGSSQCQGASPFMAGRRCDWACAGGAKCAYHT